MHMRSCSQHRLRRGSRLTSRNFQRFGSFRIVVVIASWTTLRYAESPRTIWMFEACEIHTQAVVHTHCYLMTSLTSNSHKEGFKTFQTNVSGIVISFLAAKTIWWSPCSDNSSGRECYVSAVRRVLEMERTGAEPFSWTAAAVFNDYPSPCPVMHSCICL